MRHLRQMTLDLAWPSLRDSNGMLLGLPFILAAAMPGLVLPWFACVTALLTASVASFLVYVPMTALALNGGAAFSDDTPTPPLTPRAYLVLLVLWTATAWIAAGLAVRAG